MRSLTSERTTSVAIAEALGIRQATVLSWAVCWHGPVGSGNHRTLSVVDRLVARAWQVLGQTRSNSERRYGEEVSPLAAKVEAVIRADPAPWLLVTRDTVETFDAAEEAAAAWALQTQPSALLIDLWSVPA